MIACIHRLPTLLGSFLMLALPFAAPAPAAAAPVYELRTYTATPGQRDRLLARFRNHTLRLFEKHGMTNLAYFTPADTADGAGDKIIYVLRHESREAAAASWKAFHADPQWKKVSAKSEAAGKIVAKVESVFMTPTDYSPPVAVSRSDTWRTFELRTYITPANGIGALDARFRNHTCALFEKHGMTNVAYFHPMDADKGAGRTLIYFLAFPNREAATASWKSFREDPVWIAAKAASEKKAGGSLTTEVRSVFLSPLDFSPTR